MTGSQVGTSGSDVTVLRRGADDGAGDVSAAGFESWETSSGDACAVLALVAVGETTGRGRRKGRRLFSGVLVHPEVATGSCRRSRRRGLLWSGAVV